MADPYADIVAAFEAERFLEAERICRSLLAQNDTDHRALYWLSRLAVECGQPDAGRPLLGQALATRMLPEYLLGFAQSLRRRGYIDRALDLMHSAEQRFPQDSVIKSRLGQLLADSGDEAVAERMFRDAIRLDPANGVAFLSLALIRRFTEGDPLVTSIEQAIAACEPGSARLRDLSFALGRAYHDQGRHDDAIIQFITGNSIKHASVDYDAARDAEQTKDLIEAFSPAFVSSQSGLGIEDEAPVLVVGIPRSGSTLVEQIIASHPDATGVGERLELPEVVETQIFKYLPPQPKLPAQVVEVRAEAWAAMGQRYASQLRALDPSAKRIVDKQLFNFKLLGLFQLMLPSARVVFCRRDPMDVGLSCFTSLFDSGSDFIYDLWEIGHAWRLHDELMAHWISLFGERIHTVQYEELVTDPETEVRRLIEFLGLPWSDDCLKFNETKRDVSTMSVGQVRQPMYTSSVARWRKYDRHLDALRAGLAGEPRP
jgi:tetratricopeptide (TPR) repeat protein